MNKKLETAHSNFIIELSKLLLKYKHEICVFDPTNKKIKEIADVSVNESCVQLTLEDW